MLSQVERQAELGLARPPQRIAVPMEMIRARRSAAAAFTLACEVSGLDDKELYIPLEIDKGLFSRIKSGHAALAPDLLAAFCRLTGNTVYADWLAYQVGCGLVMLKSEAERRAEAAESRAAKAEEKLAWALEVLRGGSR